MTILVFGATGNIGRHVVTGLRQQGATVRETSRATGVDLTRPETIHSALSGVDKVFLLWPFLSPTGADQVVDAIAAHAQHVVYVSALNVSDDRPPEQNGVWGQIEDAIRRSSLKWTFLRAGGFATNTLGWADKIRAGNPVRLPYPEASRSLIHERDIADVAVRALTENGHEGKTYVLTGPAALTQTEQVHILGTVAGRPASVQELTPAEARADMATWAEGEYAEAALAYWSTLVDNPEPVTDTVQRVTGHPARTFEQWAHDHADDFRPLPTAEVANRYVSAFRAGRMADALKLTTQDVVRIAPLETNGERVERRGMAEIMANAERINRDLDTHDIQIDGPYLQPNRFAVRFTFDETHKPTGKRTTRAKLSLYTVENGAVTREEVFYFDPPVTNG